jgi:hypothetical protein
MYLANNMHAIYLTDAVGGGRLGGPDVSMYARWGSGS